MLEKQRLTYLEHLGIENYIPRRVLPNALPSQLLSDEALQAPVAFATTDMPEGEISVNHTAHHESVESVVSSSPSDRVAHLLGDSPSPVQDEPTVEITEETTEKTNTSPQAGSSIRFSLSVWRIGHDLLVIDSRQPGSALPTDRLLQNILRSIAYPLAQLPPSELLRWPLFKDDQLNSNEGEARAMVQAYISAQCAKAPARAIILLGKEAVRFSLDFDGDADTFYEQHKGTEITQNQWQSIALIAPSLVDMLQDPLQKRVTWQALQSLLLPTE